MSDEATFSYGDWRPLLISTAAAVGRPDEADELIAEFDAARDAALASIELDGRTVAVVSLLGERVFVSDERTLQTDVLRDLGFELNPGIPPGTVEISLEQLSLLDAADELVVLEFGPGGDDEARAALTALPTASSVDAIVDGSVVVVDGFLWGNAGPLGQRLVLEEIAADLLAR